MPCTVLVQAEDELAGIVGAELCCSEQHDIRLVTGNRGAGRRESGRVLPLQIGSRTRDEQPARVLVHVRALCIYKRESGL